MLSRFSTLLLGASLAALLLPSGSVADRQNMLQRAQSNIEQRAAAQSVPEAVESRDTSKFRYLNKKTKSEWPI
jgi:hypothetical protein